MGKDKSIHAMCREHHVTWLELATFTAQDCVRASQSLGPLPDYTKVRIGGARVPIELRKISASKSAPGFTSRMAPPSWAALLFAPPTKSRTNEKPSARLCPA